MSTNYYLPEEIIFIILSWLPAKSLLRFSSVCKSWQSIISNKQFILVHVNNSKKKSASVLSYPMLGEDGAHACSFVCIHNQEDSIKLPLPPQYNVLGCKICSYNGLVCLSNINGENLCMWNPATRMFKILPAPNKRSYTYQNCLGFGFDSVSNDYKIIRILKIVFLDGSFLIEAELYSANADSWKEIEVPKTLYSFMPYLQYTELVCTKTGVLYWEWEVHYGLMSFDLHNEVFGLYPYPYPYPDSTASIRSYLFDFEGSAAMIYKSVDENGSVYGLRVLDDSCGKLCWTKKFNLDGDYERACAYVVFYMGVGQYVVMVDDEYMFTKCVNGKKDTTKFSSIFPQRTGVLPSIIKYTESLVSLEGFKPM